MNILVTDTTLSPASIEEECAKIIVEETMSPFVLHNVTIPGEQYTLSLWVKSNNVGSITSRGTSVSTSPEWVRYSATFTTEDTDISIYFNTIDTYYIYHAKLEIGNKATDYTVAPEDTDEAIKSADEAAKDADKKATDADKKATDADKKAADAKDKADEANKLANETSEAVTSHMIFNQTENSGLELGDYSTGKWSGFRARIAANVFEIIDSSNKVVAKYGIAEILLGYGIARYTTNTIELGRGSDNAEIILCDGIARYTKDTVELGKGSDNARILLCDGNGEIKMDANNDFMEISGEAMALKSHYENIDDVIDGDPAESTYNAHISISTNPVSEDRSIWLYRDTSSISPMWNATRGTYSSVLLNDTGVSIEAGGQSEGDYNAGIYVYDDRISMTTCTYDELQHGTSNTDIYALTPSFVIEGDLGVNGKVRITSDLGDDTVEIGGFAVKDFVIEQGSSNISQQGVDYEWNYKKWYSGQCELWCSIPVSNMNCNIELGAMFRTMEVATPAFPFTVFSPNVVSSYESPGYGAILWPTGSTTITTKPSNYYLVRPTNVTIVTGTINLQVKGKWK